MIEGDFQDASAAGRLVAQLGRSWALTGLAEGEFSKVDVCLDY
jgi:hypothetical protein